ncbi:MAG: LLM class F420-dependent oxidoreductase [Gammaproteobacteria bacterium]|nr:LLM class F420-dependent oxidoreductase [Gammaproteobacteria bacterium]
MKRKSSGIGVGVFQIMADMPGGDPAVVAKRAEELGFESYWLPEHAVIPQGSADVYPGKKADEPPPDYLFRMPDPLVALTRASATTREIRLGTGVALVPERNAILAAKEIATLDHYSGGRFVYGIGAGWNEPECTLMGGDFPHRWAQTKEAVHVMKKLWTGEYVGHEGKYYNFPPSICLPRPVQRPHPPILLGSIGSPNVYRRVAEWGDGWLPFVVDPKELTEGRAEITRQAERIGRNPKELEICAFAAPGMFRSRDGIKALAEAGADNAVVWLDQANQADVLAQLEDLARSLFD